MSRLIPLLLLVLPLQTATGQELLLEPGSRIRLTESYGRYLLGTLVSFSQDTLVMQLEDRAKHTLRIPFDRVSVIEVSQGRRRRTGRGAVIGLLAGGISGGVALGAACAGSSGSFIDCSDQVPGAALMGGMAGGAFGAVIGALIGLAISNEKWEQTSFHHSRVHVTPLRNGRLALGMSFSF